MKKVKKSKKNKKIIIKLKIEKKNSNEENLLGRKKTQGYCKRYSQEID
jgi:hypothetical protein